MCGVPMTPRGLGAGNGIRAASIQFRHGRLGMVLTGGPGMSTRAWVGVAMGVAAVLGQPSWASQWQEEGARMRNGQRAEMEGREGEGKEIPFLFPK
jgi:hypothetical protein